MLQIALFTVLFVIFLVFLLVIVREALRDGLPLTVAIIYGLVLSFIGTGVFAAAVCAGWIVASDAAKALGG